MKRDVFFSGVRIGLFAGRLTASQTRGLDLILDRAEAQRTPLAHLAYMLATAFHETAATMKPIRETRAKTDAKAIAILEKAFKAGDLPWVKKPYWRPDADGKSWLGRGLVQLTHKVNYDRAKTLTGVDLVKDPSSAMDTDVAIEIMFEGMRFGIFTKKKLSDYLDGIKPNYLGARKIINGTESDAKVAGYAVKFELALRQAGYGATAQPIVLPTRPAANPAEAAIVVSQDTPQESAADSGAGNAVSPAAVPAAIVAEKLDKPAVKSKTVWMWLLTVLMSVSSWVLERMQAIDWRVQLAIVGVIALFAVYAIKRRNDLANVVREVKAQIDAG